MSLHEPVSLKLSNKSLAGFVLLCICAGFLLPAIISPPHFLAMNNGNQRLFAEIAKLEAELVRLQNLRSQQGLSIAEQDALDQQLEDANAQLSQGLQRTQNIRSKVALLSLPTRRPPIPHTVKYSLPTTRTGVIPRVFIPRMPNLSPLEVGERKDVFVKILLPLILRANDEILSKRKDIELAYKRGDSKTLARYAAQYKIDIEASDAALYQALRLRIAPVPVSLALAQAAVESGWGQSRFTIAGNALFGQWVWNDKAGIKAREASDSRASVRTFPDLLASVRAYMLNLNSFYAYEGFRQNRALYNQGSANFDDVLAELSVYAEIGNEYVETLQTVIAQNDFNRFNEIKLKAPIF